MSGFAIGTLCTLCMLWALGALWIVRAPPFGLNPGKRSCTFIVGFTFFSFRFDFAFMVLCLFVLQSYESGMRSSTGFETTAPPGGRLASRLFDILRGQMVPVANSRFISAVSM
jgi:hypothetical protein